MQFDPEKFYHLFHLDTIITNNLYEGQNNIAIRINLTHLKVILIAMANLKFPESEAGGK